MENKYSFNLAGKSFASKRALTAYCQELLAKYPLSEYVDTTDQQFLLALLDRHPHKSQKHGVGIAYFFAAIVPKWKRRCFHIERIDGSIEHFSFIECISPTPHARNVAGAMRKAIEDQISQHRKEFFAKVLDPICPDTGVVLSPQFSHVDHVKPLTFEYLIAEFLRMKNIDVASVALTPPTDGMIGDALANEDFKAMWQDWHKQNAKLEVVSPRANLSNRRKKQV